MDDRVVELWLAPPLAAKVRHGPHGPVLVLVGAAASLLEGDVLRVALDVGAGSRLEVSSVAAQLAHPCLSGGTTCTEIDVRLGPGARLAWHPEPTIAYGGARHRAEARIELGAGARAVWLDEVVIGCRAEDMGTVSLRTRLVVDSADGPILRDGLDTDRPGARGAAVLGGARHVGTLLALGRRFPDGIGRDPAGGDLARFELEGEATLLRLTGGGTARERAVLTSAAEQAVAALWCDGA